MPSRYAATLSHISPRAHPCAVSIFFHDRVLRIFKRRRSGPGPLCRGGSLQLRPISDRDLALPRVPSIAHWSPTQGARFHPPVHHTILGQIVPLITRSSRSHFQPQLSPNFREQPDRASTAVKTICIRPKLPDTPDRDLLTLPTSDPIGPALVPGPRILPVIAIPLGPQSLVARSD